jgi:hypothetical protein
MKKANGKTPYKVLMAGYIEVCGDGSTKDAAEYCTELGLGSANVQCYTKAATNLVGDGSLKRKGRKYHENGKSYMMLGRR